MADILNKLNGAGYVTVKITDDAITNGNNLLAAYNLAKTKSFNDAAFRTIVILPPALYDLGTQSLILNTSFIDIIGSTSNKGSHYIRSNVGIANKGVITQTTGTVRLINLTIENSNVTYTPLNNSTDPCAYYADSQNASTYIENVEFRSNSFFTWSTRLGSGYYGTYVDCTGGDYSFGGRGGTTGGTFRNCTGGNYSFGGSGGTITSTAVLKDCTGGDYSFGGDSGTLSGTFTNCTGETHSFGGGGGTITSTAVLTNCIGASYSFGSFGTVSGTLTNCIGGGASFGYNGTASGFFKDCFGGNYSFGFNGIVNGNFTNCSGGIGSFNL